MAGIGNITGVLGLSGSITAPTTSVKLTVASALSTIIRDFGILDWTYLPSLRAVLFAQGTTFQYHAIDGALYLNGPRAPLAALTATSTAVRATAVLKFSSGVSSAAARPSNNEYIQVGKPGQPGSGTITFKTTLDTSSAIDQVLIGADVDATIANLTAFINGTGSNGDKWFAGRPGGTAIDMWQTQNDITVSASTAWTLSGGYNGASITFQSVTYGTGGNSYIAVDATTTGAFTSTFSSGAVGTGTDPGTGQFIYAYAYKRSADGALTALGPTTTIRQDTNCNVSLSVLADPPTRDGTNYIEYFRTLTGDNVFYSGTDTATGGAGTATDSLSDTTISGAFHVVTDAGDQARNYRAGSAGYPTWARCVAHFKGCAFAAGAIVAGTNTTISGTVTAGSKTFTATAGQLTVRMIGRTLRFTSTTDDYVIVDVSESGNTATLNRDAVSAQTGIACTITDTRDPCEVFYTPPTLFNNWPVVNSVKGVTSEDPTGITAIAATHDSLAIFTRTGLWSLYGDPASRFQILPVGDGCGNYTAKSVVYADGHLYWIGRDDVFVWGGTGKPRSLSTVEDQGHVRGIIDTLARITQSAVDGIVSVYNPSDQYVKWWIPLDGEVYNNYCLTLNTTTETFSLDRSQQAITAAGVVVGADGGHHTLVGDAYGNVFETEISNSDGAYGFECVNAITGYTASTLTIACSGAAFPTTSNGLAGVPVLMVTDGGDFVFGKIASNTSTALVLSCPLSTDPTTLDYVVVGAIHMKIGTNRFDGGFRDGRRTLSSVRATYSPSSGRLLCAACVDDDDPTVFYLRSSSMPDYANLANVDGEHLFTLRKGKGRRCKFEIHDFVPGHDTTLLSLDPVIPARVEVRA